MERKSRKTGFDPPYDTHQITSWVVMAIDLVLTSVVLIPSTHYPAWTVLACVYSVSAALTLALAYSATACDPTDPVVAEYTATISSSKPFNVEALHAYCSVCTSVVSKTSKHCSSCNRCVDKFDHHCKWLNNCIAVDNYRTFVVLITVFEINQLLQGGLSLALIVVYSTDHDSLSEHLKHVYGYSETADVFIGFFILGLVASIPIIVLNTHLIFLHLMLYFRGITTYEYIVSKRVKKVADRMTLVEQGNKPNTDTGVDSTNYDGHNRTKTSVIDRQTVETPPNFHVTSPYDTDRM